MATIYAKNKNTGEWERVGPAAAATDATLTLEGSPADAKVTGDAIRQVQDKIDGLTAADVGALPADTEIPSVEGLASEAYVNERITEVVGGAPELLNTLDELSAALNDDENFATTITNQIAEKQDKLTFDETPTEGSVNPVTSGGVKSYVDSAQVQSDLSQVDESAKDYVKGVIRQESLPEGYPYKEQSKTEFAILGEVEFGEYGDNNAQATALVNEEIVVGETYAVVLDGKEYVATAYERTTSSGLTMKMIGNAAQEDGTFDENGPPFYCATVQAGEQFRLFININAEVGTHTVEIYKLTETIHTIAEEFLPAAATAQSDLSQTDSTQPDYVKGVIRSESLPEGYPYKDGFTIEWDGDITNKVKPSDYSIYKVSDIVPTNDEIKNASMTIVVNSDIGTVKIADVFQWDNMIEQGFITDKACLLIFDSLYIAVIREENFTIDGIVFPEMGTYFFYGNNTTYVSCCTIATIHTISEEYLPKLIGWSAEGECAEKFNDFNNNASGKYSHAEGSDTTASGAYAHAEGLRGLASGNYSHKEGYNSQASGMAAHAEGSDTTASGDHSHAEGHRNTASGECAHAEGYENTASGMYAHAEGGYTKARGFASHAEGTNTDANTKSQHVQGEYNIEDTEGSQTERGKYAHIVGNGTYQGRSNAHTLDWSGNAWFAGDVYVGSTSGTNKDEGSKILATQEYVDIRVPAWTEADEGKVLKIINGIPTWANIKITSADDGAGNVVIS